jgi:hypothetical protein
LSSSSDIIRVRWAGHVALTVAIIKAYKILVEKPEIKRLHGRPRCRCEHNVKTQWGVMTFDTGYGLMSAACECANEYSGATTCWEFLDQLSDYLLHMRDSASWSLFIPLLTYSICLRPVTI